MHALISILTVHNIKTTKHAQQAVSVQNSRSWKQIQAKVSSQVNSPYAYNTVYIKIIKIEKWVERTQPSTPSFIFMYWKTEQGGHPNLVWAGTILEEN